MRTENKWVVNNIQNSLYVCVVGRPISVPVQTRGQCSVFLTFIVLLSKKISFINSLTVW